MGRNSTPKPLLFDLTARSKWEAWNELGNMTQEEAMDAYISTVDDIMKNPSDSLAFSVKVSTIQAPESIMDNEKTIWDWAREGQVERVLERLQDVHARDDTTMTLLHWASDRNHLELAKALIDKGANVNDQTLDGETPLYLAAVQDHIEIGQLLIRNGADAELRTCDGECVNDVASEAFKKCL